MQGSSKAHQTPAFISTFPFPLQSLPHTRIHVEGEDCLGSHSLQSFLPLWLYQQSQLKRADAWSYFRQEATWRAWKRLPTSNQNQVCVLLYHTDLLYLWRKALGCITALKLLLTKWKMIALGLSLHLEDSTRAVQNTSHQDAQISISISLPQLVSS